MRSTSKYELLLLCFTALAGASSCAAPVESEQPHDEVTETSEEPLKSGLTFVFAPDGSPVVPTSWEHRVVASRHLWGCYGYDVLQGTGWFPSTWYRTYTPEPRGSEYVVDLERTLRATFCDAKMDGANALTVQVADAAAAGGMLRGTLSVVPDGTTAEATVTCRRAAAPTPSSQLSCDNAHVAVPSRGTVTVHLAWAN